MLIKSTNACIRYCNFADVCQVLQRYQNSILGSAESDTSLVELASISIHSMAVNLFKLDESFHKNEYLASQQIDSATELGDKRLYFKPLPPFPSPFTLPEYSDPDQYPDGVGDLVGYWAEDRIFG